MTHDVLDMFSKSGIVTVPENVIVPTCLNRQPVKVNIVPENVLIISHLQVVNRVFGITVGSIGLNWEWRVWTNVDQLSSHSGVSSSLERAGSKKSRAVP